MREDMHRKVIECYRWGSQWLKNGEVRWHRQAVRDANFIEDYEALPERLTMRPRRGYRRQFGDNLAPLRRFLTAKLGERWDDVYAELRDGMSTRSAVHMHIFEHIDQMVSKDVILDGDRVLHHSRWRGELFFNRWTFYVHPETGRLMQPTRTRPRNRWSPPERAPHVDLGDGTLYLHYEGQWYIVQTDSVADIQQPYSRFRSASFPLSARALRRASWLVDR
ncbi:MAG: hypothetical protein AAFV53_40280 [Myxococcota bacterium]